jgi:hypothetical protein
VLTAAGGCTITHEFGPFAGKVVDAESGRPIEGAAVLIVFSVETGTLGGTVYSFADAVETLTDAKGEFRFPPKRVYLVKGMSNWSDDHQISIFKPGFGAYPGHDRAFSSWEKKHARIIPENEFITYYLPKLKTLEEIKENHNKIEIPGSINNDKMPNLRRLIDEDSDMIFRG